VLVETETDGTQTFNATVSSTASNSQNNTFSGTVLTYSLGFSPSVTFSNTDGQQLQIQLSTNQSQATEQSLTSKMTLQDCPLVNGKDSCAPPAAGQPSPSSIAVMPFQDDRFGTMMASTPFLSPKQWSTPICVPCQNFAKPLTENVAFRGIAIYDGEATPSASSSPYRINPGVYGFKSGEVPYASQLMVDFAQFKTGPTATKPTARSQPVPPVRKRQIAPAPPLQYKKPLPAPQSLVSELPELEKKFPQIVGALSQKPPASQAFPSKGTVKATPDGHLQVVPQTREQSLPRHMYS
jgi:hypothetical protein